MTERLYLGGNTFPDYSDQPKPTVAAPWMQLTPDGDLNAYDFTGLTNPGKLFSNTGIDHLGVVLPDAVVCDNLADHCRCSYARLVLPSASSTMYLISNSSNLETCYVEAPVALDVRYMVQGSAVKTLEVHVAKAVDCSYLAYGCKALSSLTVEAPEATSITALIGSCVALEEVTLNFPNVSVAGWVANGCVNLKRVHATWPKVSSLGKAFNNTAMDADALNEVFESLPSWDSGTHNIEITGSAGAADCDVTIAEQKGWTVLR